MEQKKEVKFIFVNQNSHTHIWKFYFSILLKPLDENERRLILLDAILAAINIETETEMQELIQTVHDDGISNGNEIIDPNQVYKVNTRGHWLHTWLYNWSDTDLK